MKARGPLLSIVCALAASSLLPAGASGAPTDVPELKLSTFELEGSNGYRVEVTSVREGRRSPFVQVRAERAPFDVTYETRADLGAGVRASFASFGQIDVSFERRRKKVDRPEPGCRWISEEGVFRGSFRFAGENGFFATEATDPTGEVLRLPDGFCGLGIDRPARLDFPFLNRTVLAARAAGPTGTISFEASRWHLDQEIAFSASLRQRVGNVEVERTAGAGGKKRSFLASKSSRVSVRPPWPFDGSASFRDPASGPPAWTGSLSVSLPGVPAVALTGDDFRAKLCPRVSILSRSRCLRGRERPLLYGSGSHSQPLALARLSSLR
jgi:hypothetical protein